MSPQSNISPSNSDLQRTWIETIKKDNDCQLNCVSSVDIVALRKKNHMANPRIFLVVFAVLIWFLVDSIQFTML